ncbi:MAG: UDP-N-acetylmuramate dehydrogenase [Lachnospiraceae bacterium]|nr:UDP-N-acetylmuramate dehydrogenase [Lachnospiraceae bacterium]
MNKEKILNVLGDEKVRFDEPLKNHTSFKTGGPADVLVNVANVDELIKTIEYAKEENLKFFLLGNGSNVLASDDGFRGIVIKLDGEFNDASVSGDTVSAGAGITLSKLAGLAMNSSLSGLEFASGIPGTLGGALFMNAGAYGGEMKQVVTEVTVLSLEETTEFKILTLSNEEMDFGYRHSILKEKNYIALGSKLKLQKGDKETIGEYMRELSLKRKEKQPLEFPSAGSTFKRPEGYFAGKLIEDCGLGGYTIGGAQVSEKHKGFVINKGNATASDVKDLIKHVIETVRNETGVTLEPEVLFLGKFD